MPQLGVAGEIEWAGPRSEPRRFEFRTNRPGHAYQIKADLKQGKAEVEYTKLNGWGIAHVLHTFTGVRMGESRNQRDWVFTTVWALSMDAVARVGDYGLEQPVYVVGPEAEARIRSHRTRRWTFELRTFRFRTSLADVRRELRLATWWLHKRIDTSCFVELFHSSPVFLLRQQG